MLACCPSAAPFGLALGADSPRADEPGPGNLGIPGKPWDSGVGDSHPDFRYSCPHNHSQALQRSFRATFNAAWDALLPRIREVTEPPLGALVGGLGCFPLDREA